MSEADGMELQPETPQQAAPATGSLVEEMLATAGFADSELDVAKSGLVAFLRTAIADAKSPKLHKSVLEQQIAEIDKRMGRQIDEILHNPAVQKLESSWRGLKLLIDRTDFRSNIELKILNVSKQDMLADFQDAAEREQSGLFQQVYYKELDTFGGTPYGAIIANYEMSALPQDLELLQEASAVAAVAHCPFIAAADPKFFQLDSFTQLPSIKDIPSVFKSPAYAKWRSFRESDDSRNLGLVMPRFLLRLPYGETTVPVKNFTYNEQVSDDHGQYLWGNAVFAFATRLTESFAKYGWCANIIGPQAGGAVEDLPVYNFESMGETTQKIPTEVMIPDEHGLAFSDAGFIPLMMRKESDNAAFFAACSAQQPKVFPDTEEGRAAQTNFKLGTQLPYMFIISRLAHYIKVIQRENLGKSRNKGMVHSELTKWLNQYVSEMENPSEKVMARRPLREASIDVEDVEGDPGWFRVKIKVVPHFKYQGSYFSLSLVGKLDTD